MGRDHTEVMEWRKHDSASEICPTEFGPYMVEDAGDEVWAWLPDQQKQARRRVNSGSVKGAKNLCQSDLDARRSLKAFLNEGETPAERIERERKDVSVLLELLAIERTRTEALRELIDAFEAYEPVDAALSKARAALAAKPA